MSHLSTGIPVQLVFSISQHIKDEQLMKNIIEFLGCGSIKKYPNKVEFRNTKFDHTINKIIPFFNKYPVIGVKSKDFDDFSKVAELMKIKAHLTQKGLDQIRAIKGGMNRGRTISSCHSDS